MTAKEEIISEAELRNYVDKIAPSLRPDEVVDALIFLLRAQNKICDILHIKKKAICDNNLPNDTYVMPDWPT
ncbi:MAG: hypothetical protein LBT64_03300 [Puniceicoccales bacterium]|nr:hypothetical protein [Puniceicoccales bacterium]